MLVKFDSSALNSVGALIKLNSHTYKYADIYYIIKRLNSWNKNYYVINLIR